MIPSPNCIAIVRECEGFRPNPYRCPAGVPTIGVGSTRYEDGRHVAMSDPSITLARAGEIMLYELAHSVAPAVSRYATAPLTQGQYDALIDFAYNAGPEALRTSTLLAKVNARDYAGAALEFPKWIHGGGQVLPGLVKRRELERKLFVGAA